MNEIVIVNCPICQKSVEWITENSFRPFCSKRCKLIDLGEWASENHRIPVNEADEDEQWSEAQSL